MSEKNFEDKYWYEMNMREKLYSFLCVVLLAFTFPIWIPYFICNDIWHKYKEGDLWTSIKKQLHSLFSFFIKILGYSLDGFVWLVEVTIASLPSIWYIGSFIQVILGNIPAAMACIVISELMLLNRHIEKAEIIVREED